MPEPKLFHDVLRERHSVRSFLPNPVPEEVINAVLEDAQRSPSNCNTQPWQVHIVSGAKRDEVSNAILEEDAAGRMSPDFSFATSDYGGVYGERAKAQGGAYYRAIGIARDAAEARQAASRRNLSFFGAPHAAFIFMPEVGDNVRAAGDLGMWGQTFLLSLTAHGLGGIPQTMLGFYAGTIRQVLGIDPAMKMLFGISFGYPDTQAAGSSYRIDRAPIGESVTFHR